MNENDLIWLRARRPVTELDPAVTEAARASALGGGGSRRWTTTLRWAAVAGVAAAAVLAGVIGAGSRAGHGQAATGAAAHPHVGVLELLANRIKTATPAPTGDATLIVRHQVYPDGSSIDGADLYADSGALYYAPTVAGLPAAIQSNPASTGEQLRERAAAVAALDAADPGSVRRQMAVAGFEPSQVAEMTAGMSSVRIDGYVWDNSMEALDGAAANPDVRAGVLRLLSAVPEVSVSHVTFDGQPAVALTARLWDNGYSERLTINAQTGMPLQFVGADAGKAPDVTVTYSVSRVTLSQLSHG